MANKNLLTYNSKVSQVEQLYFSPVAVLPPPISQPIGTTFCFLSRVIPWDDDNNPVEPRQDQKYIKEVFKNMFVVKQITVNDISPVTERQDWSSGTIYDYYKDDVDMFELGVNNNFTNLFYIKNRYDQVFKCLWNNNDSPSTVEPFFEPGSFGTNNIYIGTDGYKWKYMYTIDIGIKTKFMDSLWMPVPVGANTPNPLQSSAGCGDIEVINIVDGGSGYYPSNTIVQIIGDGTGASANVVVDDSGVITDIRVTNAGTNYTYANVSIVSTSGSGATVVAPISPIGGHAFDVVSELGCHRVMLTAEFDGDENGYIPTDIDYRQVGILNSPMELIADGTQTANSNIYKTTTDLIVAPGFGAYTCDEIVYQGTSLEEATFSATVLSFDPASDVVKLINTYGTPILNAPVFGYSSKTVRTLLNVSYPKFVPYSGYLVYIENRAAVQRSSDGIEQFKFVLGY